MSDLSAHLLLLAAMLVTVGCRDSSKATSPAVAARQTATPVATSTPTPTPTATATPEPTPSLPSRMTTASGAQIEVLEAGTGAMPAVGQEVRIRFTGSLEDGTIFDEMAADSEPLLFTIGEGEVMKGLDESMAMLPVGSKVRITVPPAAGYGNRAVGKIPPGSTLTLEVEVVGVQ